MKSSLRNPAASAQLRRIDPSNAAGLGGGDGDADAVGGGTNSRTINVLFSRNGVERR